MSGKGIHSASPWFEVTAAQPVEKQEEDVFCTYMYDLSTVLTANHLGYSSEFVRMPPRPHSQHSIKEVCLRRVVGWVFCKYWPTKRGSRVVWYDVLYLFQLSEGECSTEISKGLVLKHSQIKTHKYTHLNSGRNQQASMQLGQQIEVRRGRKTVKTVCVCVCSLLKESRAPASLSLAAKLYSLFTCSVMMFVQSRAQKLLPHSLLYSRVLEYVLFCGTPSCQLWWKRRPGRCLVRVSIFLMIHKHNFPFCCLGFPYV